MRYFLILNDGTDELYNLNLIRANSRPAFERGYKDIFEEDLDDDEELDPEDSYENRIPKIIIFGEHKLFQDQLLKEGEFMDYGELLAYATHFITDPIDDWDTDDTSWSIGISLDVLHGPDHWFPDQLRKLMDDAKEPITDQDYWCLILTLEDYYS